MTMQKVSKHCYKCDPITDPNEIIRLARLGESVYQELWGVKPAAIIMSMQFSLIMRLISENELFYVFNELHTDINKLEKKTQQTRKRKPNKRSIFNTIDLS